jgi:hypothetical protein
MEQRSVNQALAALTIARASARQAIADRQILVEALVDDQGAAGPLETVATNTVDAINEVRALALAGGGGGGAGSGALDAGHPGRVLSGVGSIDAGHPGRVL